ncbi:hypothetical protein D5086_009075 [Populus alba]|uniref:Uncharacterized protein n=1 Tax=Populus alba TaxID=43335 RepID=A0ACC4CJQ6_POPAL
MSILFQQQGELNAKNGEPKASSSISEATTEKQPNEPDQLHSSSSASLSPQPHEPASELEEQPGTCKEKCRQHQAFWYCYTARNACFTRSNIHKHCPDKDSMHKIPPDATCHKKRDC